MHVLIFICNNSHGLVIRQCLKQRKSFGNIYREANLVIIHSRRRGSRRILTQTESKLLVLLHSLFNMSAIKLTIMVAAFVAICKGEDSSLDICSSIVG